MLMLYQESQRSECHIFDASQDQIVSLCGEALPRTSTRLIYGLAKMNDKTRKVCKKCLNKLKKSQKKKS